MIVLRHATPEDAHAINRIIKTVWPDDAKSDDFVADVIAMPEHVTQIASVDGIIAGFVSAFPTVSEEKESRWEVDLLAVDPVYSRRRIAHRLVAASTEAGRLKGLNLARALTFVDNNAVFDTFSDSGYTRSDQLFALYVCLSPSESSLDPPVLPNVIPVTTLTYGGGWLTGELIPEALTAGRFLLGKYEWDLVGAVFPTSRHDLIKAAEAENYRLTGHYYWWTRYL
jgi:N-acetylglutamate synthase-like GNAT family acetyltransferase